MPETEMLRNEQQRVLDSAVEKAQQRIRDHALGGDAVHSQPGEDTTADLSPAVIDEALDDGSPET